MEFVSSTDSNTICKTSKAGDILSIKQRMSSDGSLRDLSSSSTTGDDAEVVACTWKHFKT